SFLLRKGCSEKPTVARRQGRPPTVEGNGRRTSSRQAESAPTCGAGFSPASGAFSAPPCAALCFFASKDQAFREWAEWSCHQGGCFPSRFAYLPVGRGRVATPYHGPVRCLRARLLSLARGVGAAAPGSPFGSPSPGTNRGI